MTVFVNPSPAFQSTDKSFSTDLVKNFVELLYKSYPNLSRGLGLTEHQLSNVKNWIEALRSNRYTQDNCYLRTDKGFCCLGVACDLLDPKGWSVNPEYSWGISHYTFNYQGEESLSFIKDRTVLSYGLPHELQYFLSSMNDKYGKNFKFIADFVEELIKDN